MLSFPPRGPLAKPHLHQPGIGHDASQLPTPTPGPSSALFISRDLVIATFQRSQPKKTKAEVISEGSQLEILKYFKLTREWPRLQLNCSLSPLKLAAANSSLQKPAVKARLSEFSHESASNTGPTAHAQC